MPIPDNETVYTEIGMSMATIFDASDDDARFLLPSIALDRRAFSVEADAYVGTVSATLAGLAADGFASVPPWSNDWSRPGFAPRIRSTWLHRGTGQRVEMSFHTPASAEAYSAILALHDRERRAEPEEASRLRAEQHALAAAVPVPEGAAELGGPRPAAPESGWFGLFRPADGGLLPRALYRRERAGDPQSDAHYLDGAWVPAPFGPLDRWLRGYGGPELTPIDDATAASIQAMADARALRPITPTVSA